MGIDPQMLERLRRGVPLRLTATGAWRFDEQPVTHRGVDAALRAGLDVSDGGEPIVRIGPHWCYVTVDDCPLRTTAVTADPEGRPRLRLDDGRVVALDPTTVWEEPGRGLRCAAPAAGSGRPLSVRFTNAAQMDLLTWLDDDTDPPCLVVGADRHPLHSRAPASAPLPAAPDA